MIKVYDIVGVTRTKGKKCKICKAKQPRLIFKARKIPTRLLNCCDDCVPEHLKEKASRLIEDAKSKKAIK